MILIKNEKIKITSKRNYNKTINSIPTAFVKSLVTVSSKMNDLVIIKQRVSYNKSIPYNSRAFEITHIHNYQMKHRRTNTCVQDKCY